MIKGSIHPNRMDYTGRKSGLLTVVSFAYYKGKHGYWNCVCECGNEKVVVASHLGNDPRNTRSCGCRPNKRSFKHGGSHSPEWSVWKSMRQRCGNPKSMSYPDYGARGISVCARWSKFENFLADMGLRPVGPVRYTLERKDNDGNYEPSNCRWATYKEQSLNTRKPRVNWIPRLTRSRSLSTSDGLLYA